MTKRFIYQEGITIIRIYAPENSSKIHQAKQKKVEEEKDNSTIIENSKLTFCNG